MTEITRFKLDHSGSDVRLIASADGSFVAWYDHERVVRELERQLSEAKAEHGKTLLLLSKAAFEK